MQICLQTINLAESKFYLVYHYFHYENKIRSYASEFHRTLKIDSKINHLKKLGITRFI